MLSPAAAHFPIGHDPRRLSRPESEACLDSRRSGGRSPQTSATDLSRTSVRRHFSMGHMSARPPVPYNEPIRSYAPGSAERASLQSRLTELAADQVDMPLVIGGREVRNGRTVPAV